VPLSFREMPNIKDPEIKEVLRLIREDKLDVNLSATQVIDQVHLLKLRCLTDPKYKAGFPKYWSRTALKIKREGGLGRRFGGEPTPPNPEDFPPAPKPPNLATLVPPTPLRSPLAPPKAATSSKKSPLSLSPGSLASSDDDDSVKSNNHEDILDNWDNDSNSDNEGPVMSKYSSFDTSIGDLVNKMSKTSVHVPKPGGYILSMKKTDWPNQKQEQRCTYMLRLPSGVGIDDTSASIIPADGKGNPLIWIEWQKCDAMTDPNIFHDRYERGDISGITESNLADLMSFMDSFKTQTAKTTQSQMVSSADF
jgi:hypothetical protein